MKDIFQKYCNHELNGYPISNYIRHNYGIELNTFILDKLGDWIKANHPRFLDYEGTYISIYSIIFDESTLTKMFGPPIIHDEYGEGNSIGDDEIGTMSWFIDTNGSILHFSLDRTGLKKEIIQKREPSPVKCLEAMKELINLWINR